MGRRALAVVRFSIISRAAPALRGGALILFAFAACGHDSKLDQPANACVEGQTASCSCKDGSSGFQRCAKDGVYSVCQCIGAAPASGGSDMSTPDAGDSSVGSGGTQSSGAGGGSGAAPGTAGTGIPTPTAGSGAGRPPGTAGSGADAGQSGSAGSAGTTAGSSGSAGSASGSGGIGGFGAFGGLGGFGAFGGFGGTSGAGGSATAGTGSKPMPGSAYGRCTPDRLCNDGLLCVSTNQGGNTEGYCAPGCMTRDDGSTTECPQPTSGDVSAVCVSFAELCALTPCGEASCPRGMVCVGRNGQASQGTCQYPARP